MWAACRRTLPDATDAEDAFQTSFLVLVRRARRLRSRDTIGPWLYQVAVWTARNIRRRNARILSKRQPLGDTAAASKPVDLRSDLDEALAALPEKYRTPLVLCHLQGWTRREAAARLGCPEGTLSSLLSRGLERLRVKLAGIDPAKALAVAAPAVPTLLATSTVKAAAGMHLAASATVHQLVEGVVRMFWIKKATAASFALVAMFGMGIGVGVSVQQVPGAAAGDGPLTLKDTIDFAQDQTRIAIEDKEVQEAEAILTQAEKHVAEAMKAGDEKAVAEAKVKLDHARSVLERIRQLRALEARDEMVRRRKQELKSKELEEEVQKLKSTLDVIREKRKLNETILRLAKERAAAAGDAKTKEESLRTIDRTTVMMKALDSEEEKLRSVLESYARQLADLTEAKDVRSRSERELDDQIAKLMAEQRALEAEAEKLALMRELKQRELAKLKETRATKVVPVEKTDEGGTVILTIVPDNTSFKVAEIGADGKVIGTATFDNLAILKQFLLRIGRDPKSPKSYRMMRVPSGVDSLQRCIDVVRICESAGLKPVDEKANRSEGFKDLIDEHYKQLKTVPDRLAK